MKVGAMFPSKYITATEIGQNVFRLTIARVVVEDVGDDSGHQPVVYFQEAQKGFVLNRTNANTLEWLYGDESDGWIGRQVDVFAEMTTFRGKPMLGKRLRGPGGAGAVPPQAQTPPSQPLAQPLAAPIAPQQPAADPFAGASTPRGPGEQATAQAQPTLPPHPGPGTDLDDEIPF